MNRSKRLVRGVGVKGKGSSWINNKRIRSYSVWDKMLERCYSKKRLSIKPQYEGCTVCEEWLNYEDFEIWFNDNYIDGYHLDKDIINSGNKIYSPENCCFVPKEVNNLLTDSKAARGKYPVGVNFVERSGKYRSSISKRGKKITIGLFSNPESAHKAYVTEKELHIKKVAITYFSSGLITKDAYYGLIKYQVDRNKEAS